MRLFGKIIRTVKFCDRGFRIHKQGRFAKPDYVQRGPRSRGAFTVDGHTGSLWVGVLGRTGWP
jgi:hypothetical protein